MKNLITLFLIIIISPTVFAQSLHQDWMKRYMSPTYENLSFYSEKVIADGQGNLLIGGISDTLNNNYMIRLMKLDTAGQVIWQFSHPRFYASAIANQAFSDITTDAANNIYVAYSVADSVQFGVERWCVMKISSSGTIIWDKMYTGQYGDAAYPTAIEVDGSGNVYSTGLGSNTSITDAAMVTIKLNSSGTLVWDNMIDGNSTNFGNFTAAGLDLVLDGNNVYVAGTIANFDSIDHLDLVLAKYSAAGALVWSKVVDDTIGYRSQVGNKVALDPNGDIVVSGTTSSVYQNFYNDLLVLKYSPSGNLIWKKIHNDNVDEQLYDMLLDNSGNVYLGSGEKPFAGFNGYAGQIIKLNGSTGDTAWVFTDMATDWLPVSLATDGIGKVFAWGVQAFGLSFPQPRLVAFGSAGAIISDLTDATGNFQSLQAQNIIYQQGHCYAASSFTNTTTSTSNGLLQKFSTDGTTGLQESAMGKVAIYPNPFSSTFQIQRKDGDHAGHAGIFSANGTCVKSFELNAAEQSVDLSGMGKGVYLLQISNGNQQLTKVLVKE